MNHIKNTQAFRAHPDFVTNLVPWDQRGRPWFCYSAYSEQSLKGLRSLCIYMLLGTHLETTLIPFSHWKRPLRLLNFFP